MIDVREAMRRAARWNADRVAVVSGDRQLTFREAWARGLRLANGLNAMGLKAGDRIAVLEDNGVEAADFFLGAVAGNFVRVPLYRRNSPEAHAHMVRHTGCRAIVVSAEYERELENIQERAPELAHVFVRRGDYEQWLFAQSDADPDPPVHLDDFHVIRHSGGTTGQPKGMAFSHRAWMHTERDWILRLPAFEIGDACTHVGPISHGSGYLFVPTWIAGGYSILETRFEARRVLDLLDEHGGYAFAVPTMLSDILALKDDKQRRFEKLKAVVVSGAPIRENTAREANALFGAKLYQLYGQTEAVPAAVMTPREWFEAGGGEAIRSVGRIMPFAKVEVRDEENRPLKEGEIGEIAIQTDGQMVKIWNEPEMTAQRVVDGWVLTGDIGRIDENGFLYLVDRKDDMIISGGFNIWPAELEIAIASYPEVREVVVVAAPHAHWGETPVAIVVLNPDAALTEQQVIDVCVTRLGGYKKPTKVILQREPLPRTPVGKISRKQIREPFWSSADGRLGGA
ncbi:MAG: class I adenylate-forming enzyme family protein [Hyphomonadaceae bacterium]